MARTARVIVASNRAAAGIYSDRTGPIIEQWLSSQGFAVPKPVVVPDGAPVGVEISLAVKENVDVVITTGGTGINPTDLTPQVTAKLLDYEIPGLADSIRQSGLPKVPTAILSRGLAGVAGRTLIVNLPGSAGGVRDGLAVVEMVLDHALSQLSGGDHSGAQKTGELPKAQIRLATISETSITQQSIEDLVADAHSGAIVGFAGVVRDHDHGRSVTELEYVGHPSAADIIQEVAEEIATKFAVTAIATSHRIGTLAIGDLAFSAAVSSPHRKEAFTACAELVDEVKRRLPIWKRQLFTDGTEEWVNCP